MTSPATPTMPKTENASKTPLWVAAEANELGHITGLEPRAQYFVVRKPTPELTKERTQAFVEDVRAFLHEQRVLAERQSKELQEKYGEPAKARVAEFRSTLEKRFDEIAKELESRVEKIEADLNDRGILRTKKEEAAATASTSQGAGETPGEMPTGNSMNAGPTSDASKSAPKKKPATK